MPALHLPLISHWNFIMNLEVKVLTCTTIYYQAQCLQERYHLDSNKTNFLKYLFVFRGIILTPWNMVLSYIVTVLMRSVWKKSNC